MIQLTANERQIMDLIWGSEKPLSRQEILNGTEGRTWNPASIHLILNSMQSKGILKITDESVRYARTYEAAISQEEYIAQCVNDVAPGKTPKERVLNIVAALVNRKGVDEETIDELKDLLAEKKAQLNKK